MPPSVVLLWLITYCAFPSIVSLLLGSSTLRKRVVAIRRSYCGSFHHTPSLIVSTVISTLIQTAATAGTGHILHATDPNSSSRSMALLWFSRPLATPIIQWLTLINFSEYSRNSWEIAWVDTIYGLVSVAVFGVAAGITNQKNPSDVPRPARLARAGSALGILHFMLTVLLFLHVYALELREKIRVGHIVFSFCHSSLRFVACWLLFAGLLFTNPTAFCPSTGTMKRILVLWFFVAFLDHFLRMLAGCDGSDEDCDDEEC
jgi:hypothetical protein